MRWGRTRGACGRRGLVPGDRGLPGRAAGVALVTAMAVALTVSGCSTAALPASGSGGGGEAGPTAPVSATDRGAATAYQNPDPGSAGSPSLTTAAPVRVRIAAIGVDSGLESLTRDAAGSILPPVDFDSAGWYSQGVVPGRIGPAVIAGHIDSAVGPAVFFRLASLVAGDSITVSLSDGTETQFTVDSSIQVAKADFPTAQVYGPTPTPQLRLITCGGVFDDSRGHYLDNVVVFASLSPTP